MVSVVKYTPLQIPDFQSADKYHCLSLDILCRDPFFGIYPSAMASSIFTPQITDSSSTFDLDPTNVTVPFDVLPELKIDAGFDCIEDPCAPLFPVKEEEDTFSEMDHTETGYSSTSSSPLPLQDQLEDKSQEETKITHIPRRARKVKITENKNIESRSTRAVCQTVSSGNRRTKRGGKKQIRLWEFIRELLENKDLTCHITWVSKEEGTFRLLNSGAVAKMWGKTKNRTDMTYEKMSRAMRYYYAKEILLPIPQKLTYKFGDKIRDELNSKVR